MHVLNLCFHLFYIYTDANKHICFHFLGVQHFTLHLKTFVFACLNMCACISRHLCLHFLTYVTSYVFAFTLTGHLWLHIWCGLDRCAFIGPYFFVTHITYATTNANTCVQKRINKCTHMQQQMHKILFCENMIFLICFVITLNRTLFSQNKTVCIC